MEENKIRTRRTKIEENPDKEIVTIIDPVTRETKNLINCLRNEKVIVRFILKPGGLVEDRRSPYYGGFGEFSVMELSVPRLRNTNTFVNVLTKDEMDYLEYIMGLPKGTFNVYNKVDNYWSCNNSNSIHSVRLTKRDTILDLSNPEDYIKYKILLTQTDLVCPSQQRWEDAPRPTYKFMIVNENSEAKSAGNKMDIKMDCYEFVLQHKNDNKLLKAIIEIFEGQRLSSNIKPEFLKVKIHDIIEANSKRVHKIMTDPLLEFKAVIKEAVETGDISDRNNFFYLKETGQPLCEVNEDPTLNNAARYLSNPKNQDLYYSLRDKTK